MERNIELEAWKSLAILYAGIINNIHLKSATTSATEEFAGRIRRKERWSNEGIIQWEDQPKIQILEDLLAVKYPISEKKS